MIELNFSLSFIPFYATYSVTNIWNNEAEKFLLSYRRKNLVELLKQNPNLKTRI